MDQFWVMVRCNKNFDMQKCNMGRSAKQHWDLFVAVHLCQATDVSAAVAVPLRLFDLHSALRTIEPMPKGIRGAWPCKA